MPTNDFQVALNNLLREKLNGVISAFDINTEWHAFSGNSHSYSPVVDIAVGPYSVEAGESKADTYDRILAHDNSATLLLRQLHEAYTRNIVEAAIPLERLELTIPAFHDMIRVNWNARCLFAIEIENTSSKKHIMGSLVNAASLGRVGIGVAYNESVKRTFIRIVNYMAFLRRVEKTHITLLILL